MHASLRTSCCAVNLLCSAFRTIVLWLIAICFLDNAIDVSSRSESHNIRCARICIGRKMRRVSIESVMRLSVLGLTSNLQLGWLIAFALSGFKIADAVDYALYTILIDQYLLDLRHKPLFKLT